MLVGLPENALNIAASLYDYNYCQVRVQGQNCRGFAMSNGVRQGCPLTHLLYALAADAFCTEWPGVWICAYADDTAVIPTDLSEERSSLG